jgi:hypothetical protein
LATDRVPPAALATDRIPFAALVAVAFLTAPLPLVTAPPVPGSPVRAVVIPGMELVAAATRRARSTAFFTPATLVTAPARTFVPAPPDLTTPPPALTEPPGLSATAFATADTFGPPDAFRRAASVAGFADGPSARWAITHSAALRLRAREVRAADVPVESEGAAPPGAAWVARGGVPERFVAFVGLVGVFLAGAIRVNPPCE